MKSSRRLGGNVLSMSQCSMKWFRVLNIQEDNVNSIVHEGEFAINSSYVKRSPLHIYLRFMFGCSLLLFRICASCTLIVGCVFNFISCDLFLQETSMLVRFFKLVKQSGLLEPLFYFIVLMQSSKYLIIVFQIASNL